MSDVVTERSISLAAAQRVLAAAVAKAAELGLPACIAVCDSAANPKLAARMDGAPLLSVGIAADKAWTVASFHGIPTARWWDIIKDEPALVHGITNTPRLTVFGGGVPLVVGGEMVGAIGVSGGSAGQDHEIAEAGAAALEG